LLLAASGSETFSSQGHLDKARQLYESQRFEQAIEELNIARQLPEESQQERNEILTLLGRAQIAERQSSKAEKTFTELLNADPAFELDPSLSPKVQKIFQTTKAHLFPPDYVGLKLFLPSPETVQVKVIDPWHRVQSVFFHVRPRSQETWVAEKLSRRGDVYDFLFSPGALGERLWFVEAVSDDGTPLARLGSTSQPYVYSPPVQELVSSMPASAILAPHASPVSVFSKPHPLAMWIVAAAAIAAAGAGTYFQLQSAHAQNAAVHEPWVDTARADRQRALADARWATGLFVGAGLGVGATLGLFLIW
jgi:tetratricopeptide (TPR) repeat protein